MKYFMRLWLLLCVVSFAPDVLAQAADAAAAPIVDAYRLEPGDLLTVLTWKEPELSAETAIRPDGMVSFPLAGDVRAAGRTVEELRQALEQNIRRLVPEASVSIALKIPQGNRVYVIGKVQKPGDFILVRPTDVMQALALAGGATPFADVNDIKILRREGGRQVAVSFHYGDVERGRHLDQNILLKGGDTVVVP